MKIVDAFIFYNELDMLEYRLNVLDPHVDYFVLVEATRTHVGNEKHLFYEENKSRYAKFAHKIIHIIDDQLIANPKVNPNGKYDDEVWSNENHQRNYIHEGIKQLVLEPTDLIMISDVDEIPNMVSIKEFIQNKSIDYVNLEQDMYYYNLLCKTTDKWYLAKIVSFKCYTEVFKNIIQPYRTPYSSSITIPKAGWHLSYFGDAQFIKNKIINFTHQEFNDHFYTNIENINDKIKNNADLFERAHVTWISIPIEDNNNLPPLYKTYLSKFTIQTL